MSQPYNIDTRRNFAKGAVRSESRKHGWGKISPEDALLVLDDLNRTEPELLASQWYAKASETQIKKFKREREKELNT